MEREKQGEEGIYQFLLLGAAALALLCEIHRQPLPSVAKENGMSYSPDQVLLSNAAKQCITQAVLAVCSPGDEALTEEVKARYDKAVFKVVDLDHYAAEDEEYEEKLKKETITLLFLATYGDGEPTDNAPLCLVGVQGNERGEWLSNLRFCVFGLGNRRYERFNKVGKLVNQLLAEQA